MAKNIPITAKLSKGLFGQKATEPVLNVGQAGVYGNNVTKGDPSPAKMMKSPFKQVKSEGAGDKILKGQANASIGSTGPDQIIKGTPGGTANVDNVKNTYNKKMPAGWKPTAAQTAAANKRVADAKAKDAASGTPDQVIPGENTTEKVPLRTYNEGSAKTSFWRRQDDRAVTHTSRKKKRADIQLSKIEAKQGYKVTKDDKGVETKTAITDKSKHVKESKLQAKKEMWESRQAGYKGSREAAVLQSEQSTRVHDKFLGAHVNRDKEEVLDISRTKASKEPDYEIQTEMEAGAYKTPRARATAGGNTNPLTGKPAGGLADTKSADVKAAEAPKTESPKVEDVKKPEVSTITEDQLNKTDSPADKTMKGFFSKRSPLKMKYFK
jgi:hypothetical protein